MKQFLPFHSGSARTGCLIISLFFSSSTYGQTETSDTLQIADHKPPFQENSGTLQSADFNKGFVPALEQAITAQFAGLRITPHSGKPGTPYTMEAGHGNSFFGNNSPLLVIDGVIQSYADVTNNTGLLSFLNPEDVASVELLRDAAAMAVYGGRAVNGVLVITTKSGKAGSRLRVQFNSTGAVSSLRKKADVLTGDEMRHLLQTKYPNYTHLAGTHNTDWQDVIYQNGYGLDNTLSLSGVIKSVPYRISTGHLSQRGILKTSGRERTSFALNLNPSLFQEHLSLHITLQHSDQTLRVANDRAIEYALDFDPTQPVYAPNAYGGYYLHTRRNGETVDKYPNPLGLLEQHSAQDRINSWNGQAHLRYKLHFLPSLSLNYRRALRRSNSDYRIETDEKSSWYSSFYFLETQENNNKHDYNEAFADYTQSLPGLQGHIKVTGGVLKTKKYVFNENIRYTNTEDPRVFSVEGKIRGKGDLAFYGNMDVAWRDRYSVLLSLRDERNSPERVTNDIYRARSVGANFGWDLKKTALVQEVAWVSQLQALLSGGLFSRLDDPNQFLLFYINQFGMGPNLVSEKTLAKRLDLSYGLWQNKLQGSVAYYHNQSSDMMLAFMVPPALGHPGYAGRSDGKLRTSGLETTFTYKAIDRGDFYLNLGLNASLMSSKVLELGKDVKQIYYDERHNRYLISEVGRPIQSFTLFKQLYGLDGKPLTGYETKDNRPIQHVSGAAKPNLIGGFQTNAGYGRWHASMLLRGSFGHDVYNTLDANGSVFYVGQNTDYVTNVSRVYEKTGFYYPYTQSDYFLEPGSFVRLEYLQLQYDFGRLAREKANLKLHATAQNAFVLTKYSGQDPEVRSGMDLFRTPQPRTFSVGLQVGI